MKARRHLFDSDFLVRAYERRSTRNPAEWWHHKITADLKAETFKLKELSNEG